MAILTLAAAARGLAAAQPHPVAASRERRAFTALASMAVSLVIGARWVLFITG